MREFAEMRNDASRDSIGGARRADERLTDGCLDALIVRARRLLEAECPGSRLPGDIAPLIARVIACALVPEYAGSVEGVRRPPRRTAAWSGLSEQATEWLGANGEALVRRLIRYAGHEVAELTETAVARHGVRLAAFSADLLTSHPLAPPIQLLDTPPPISPRSPWHALVFETPAHASHELWPLLVDALQAGALGYLSGLAVGAHTSWLDSDGRLQRALWYNPDTDRLIESDLPRAKQLRSAHLLVGPAGREGRWHATMASRLRSWNCTVVNPVAPSSMADDKWATWERWRDAGVPTPETWLVPRRALRTAWRATAGEAVACAGGAALLVKPRHGTEGRGIVVVPDGGDALERAVESVLREDDALVQVFRGHLRWRSEQGSLMRATLRLHAASNGRGDVVIESGYAHVAGDAAAAIASVGKEGKARPLVREHLWLDPPVGTKRPLTVDDVTGITACARDAARALAVPSDPLRLMGMDLLVEMDADGRARALALEANPRPAGLGHSRFLTAGWQEAGQPGVSIAVWEGRE